MALAAGGRRWSGAVGGGVIGLGIAVMHYVGMAAYRVDGIVTWKLPYVAGSILLSIGLSAIAFHVLNACDRWRTTSAVAWLSVAVVALHFTGMAAMKIAVLKLGHGLSGMTIVTLATTTTVATLIIVGCAAISALIDGHTQSETYRRLRHMALHDSLTDLPNRIAFIEELEARFAIRGGYQRMAVIMMDLSRFKVVNDTYGHQAGDQLLAALAARLSSILRPGECVARLGGDEFSAVVSYDDPAELLDFLDRLTTASEAPFLFDRFTASIGANIGVALAMRDGFRPGCASRQGGPGHVPGQVGPFQGALFLRRPDGRRRARATRTGRRSSPRAGGRGVSSCIIRCRRPCRRAKSAVTKR